jgi:hypothetical protein
MPAMALPESAHEARSPVMYAVDTNSSDSF